ncbi:MAG: hypothetical protein AB7F96_07515 [Beijerinckiaceae bacterium]
MPEGIQASDYHLIEDAVMDTARGRWFLREYARRIRANETAQVLDAIGRLEAMVANRPVEATPAETDAPAGFAPPAVPAGCNTALAVQEKLLDIVWYMRERGFDGRLCAAIRGEAMKLGQIAEVRQSSDQDAGRHDAAAPAPSLPPAVPAEVEVAPQAQALRPAATDDDARHSQRMDERPEFGAQDPRPATSSAAAPSRAAVIAQKSSAFSAIDALPERERLALFA